MFGMTPPVGSPTPATPPPGQSGTTRPSTQSGMTRPAKRPMNRASIQVAVTGERPLTHEDLTTAFCQLLRRVKTEEAFTNSLHDTVVSNADLLDQVQQRAAQAQASLSLVGPKFEQIESEMTQNMIDVMTRLGQEVIAFDTRLREELDAVVEEIDRKMKESNNTLSEIINAVANQQQGSTSSEFRMPSIVRDLAALQSAMDAVRAQVATMPLMFSNVKEMQSRVTNMQIEVQAQCTNLQAQVTSMQTDFGHKVERLQQAIITIEETQRNSQRSTHQSGDSQGNSRPQNPNPDPFRANDPWRGGGAAGNNGQSTQGTAGTSGEFGSGVDGRFPSSTPPHFGSGDSSRFSASAPPHTEADRDRSGRWLLFDEKVHINGKLTYDSRKPATWLQDVRDYIAGRTLELDQLIEWVEAQEDEISWDRAAADYGDCIDCAPMAEISRQLWGFLGPLVKEDNDKATVYRTVPRHNGLKAWRRIAEPINKDKSLMRKKLLPLVNKPKGAANVDELEKRIEDWSTNCRLMIENGGTLPDDYTRRMAFVGMLPAEVQTHVMMKLEEPDIETYAKIKKWVTKYVKVFQQQKTSKKGVVNVIENDRREEFYAEPHDGDDDEDDWHMQRTQLLDQMREEGVNPDTQSAVLAIMRGRFQKKFKPNGRTSGPPRNGQSYGPPCNGQGPNPPP